MLDFDTLYREYAPRVHRFVLGLSGDHATAEDVTAADRIALRRVLEALATLDAGDRAAILMRAQEEMSYEEIARSLRISVPAAKVRVHRARKKLKEIAL
ncbi:MAG: RNA polymerase sigma factor [Vicinamibacterales bacterium]